MNAPKLAEATKETFAQAFQSPARIDAEIFHMMDKRDEALISDEILHGAMAQAFIYDFNLAGTQVSGISVRGAQHMARFYGGLKHRIVASTQKTGKLFTFKSYPSDGVPMSVSCSVVPELESEPDFYECVVEIVDIKTGNSIQISRMEKRFEKKRDGTFYERPNYTVIAESKARRNAYLALVPQDVQEQFKQQCRKLEKGVITVDVIGEKRDGILKFAASRAIPLDREQVHGLAWDQINGLSEAAKSGLEDFKASAEALGLLSVVADDKRPDAKTEPKKAKKVQEAQVEPKSAGDAGAPAESAEKKLPLLGTIEIPLDFQKRPMWTPYKNELVKAMVAITNENDLMEFQHANASGATEMRQHAETIFQEYAKAAEERYKSFQKAA